VSYLTDAVGMLKEHASELGTFMTTDERGKKLPAFLANLSKELIEEQGRSLEALETLTKHIEHTANIIQLQQSYSKTKGLTEPMSIAELVEDAIRINTDALTQHSVEMKHEFVDLPPVLLDRHKVLQILTNLISNAKKALSKSGRDEKILTIRVKEPEDGHFRIEVSDNGIGIVEENLTRIFEYKFTTSEDGHGFGLHSAALAANEMNGSLSTHSDGPGKGAVFTLELPFKTQETAK
jgi:signal transduction histidine kinase